MLRFRDFGGKIFRILIRDASTRRMTVTAIVLLAAGPASYAAERLRFWNLTKVTIAELYLAPVGTAEWGPNQCLNDPDKSVDSDERRAGSLRREARGQERPRLHRAER